MKKRKFYVSCNCRDPQDDYAPVATATFSPKGSWGDRICEVSLTPELYKPFPVASAELVVTLEATPLTDCFNADVDAEVVETGSVVEFDDLRCNVNSNA